MAIFLRGVFLIGKKIGLLKNGNILLEKFSNKTQ